MLYASTLCGACYDVCPVAINIPEALVYLRSKAVDAKRGKKFSPERALFGVTAWGLRSPRRLKAAQRAASASRKLVGRSGTIRRLPPPLSGWTSTRDAPAPPPESFRAWWARTRGPGVPGAPGDSGGPGVSSDPGDSSGPQDSRGPGSSGGPGGSAPEGRP